MLAVVGGAIPALANFPGAGIDGFESDMNLVVDVTGVGEATTTLEGPVAVSRGEPRDDDGTRVVDTEIVSMSMTGQFMGFDVELRINPEVSSVGEVRANGPTSDFPADSFFDVFFEVEIEGVGVLVNLEPFRVEAAGLKALPPVFDTYTHPPTPQIPLVMKGTAGPVVATVQGESSHGPVQRPTFSIAAGGSLDPATGYGLPKPPPVVLTRAGLGLAAGDDLDALSFGHDPIDAVEDATLAFSVDPAAAGKANTGVDQEAQNGEAEGAEFVTYVDDTNLLFVPADILVPVVGDPGDDLDAITDFPASEVDTDDDQIPNDPVFFSLAPGSPTLTSLSASTADVLVTQNGTASIFATAADMGLTASDDIDAMCLMKSGLPLATLRPGSGSPQAPPPGAQTFDYMLYSLAAGSLTLTSQGHSPGDIFVTDFSNNRPNLVNQPIELYAEADEIGLLDSDELNALKCLPPVFAVEITGDGDLDPETDDSGCEGGGESDPIPVAFAMDMGLVYGDADFNEPPTVCTGFGAPCSFGFYDFWTVQNPAAGDYHGPYGYPGGPTVDFLAEGDPATVLNWVGGPGDNCGLPHVHGEYYDPYLFLAELPPHQDPDVFACGHGVFVPSAFPISVIPTRRKDIPALSQELVDLLNQFSGGLFSVAAHVYYGPRTTPTTECTDPQELRAVLLFYGIALSQFNFLAFGQYSGPDFGEQMAVAPPGTSPPPIQIGPPTRVLPVPLSPVPEPGSGLLGATSLAVLGGLARWRRRARGTRRPQ